MLESAEFFDQSPQHDQQLGRLGHAKAPEVLSVACKTTVGSSFHFLTESPLARIAGRLGTRKGGE
jgi:hypothetical protein